MSTMAINGLAAWGGRALKILLSSVGSANEGGFGNGPRSVSGPVSVTGRDRMDSTATVTVWAARVRPAAVAVAALLASAKPRASVCAPCKEGSDLLPYGASSRLVPRGSTNPGHAALRIRVCVVVPKRTAARGP
jgi:hypothetical protein